MKNYIVYDQTGNILRTGICPDHLLKSEAGEGEKVIEGIASDKEHFIVNGNIQERAVDVDVIREEALEKFRMTRNSKLGASDWTQLPDSPLTPAQAAEWRVYRQQLRDLPEQAEINWPEIPSNERT